MYPLCYVYGVLSTFFRRHLTLDIPATPLFKDSQGGNIIPQIPLFKVLDKYNGQNWTVR